MDPAKIRRAGEANVAVVADLIVRMKRLNSEFDLLFVVIDDAKERTTDYAD